MQSEARRIQATIADLAAVSTDADRIAAIAASTWREIHTVLSPVIGPGGVAALFQRAVYVTRAAYPGLTAVREDPLRPGDFAALRLALAQQSAEQIAAANGALLQAFCDLLANLIGLSLTERLLRSVRNLPAADPVPPDRST
jgi:hypothetical protein